jgi:hypothetical protein
MPMDAGTLYNAIAEVCPVISTVVEDASNRSTWSYEADASATQPQKDAADNVVQTIPMDPLNPVEPGEFITRFTEAEYLLLEQKKQTDLEASNVALIRIWDIVIGSNSLDMNSGNAQTLKADLVAGGILTQQRADAIFGQGGTTLAAHKKWKVPHGC